MCVCLSVCVHVCVRVCVCVRVVTLGSGYVHHGSRLIWNQVQESRPCRHSIMEFLSPPSPYHHRKQVADAVCGY